MTDRRIPLVVEEYVRAAEPTMRALGRRLRAELEAAGIRIPPREDEDVTSLVQPVDPSTVDVEARNRPPSPIDDPEGYGQWNADRIERTLAADRAKLPAILSELRVEAEALLDGTDEGDSDRHVILEALKVLARVEGTVVRELGRGWRRQVRPFGALARRNGTQVGAAWVGDGDVEPISLADAVEHLAADRAQLQREADESRTRAGEAVAQARTARQEASGAARQVDKIRQLLDDVLRPNAHAAADCDTCTDGTYEDWPCEGHDGLSLEPPLSDDLAEEVRRVVRLWHEAREEARQARRGRVSVYVGGRLVSGPPVLFEATLEGTAAPAEGISREVHAEGDTVTAPSGEAIT